MRLVLISFLLLTAPVFVHAQAIPNPNFRETAVIPYFHKVNPDIVSFQTFYKKVLDEQYTLLLIRGGAPIPGWDSVSFPMQHFWWNQDDLLGLFLAETANPDRIWELAVLKSNYGTSVVGVDRADSSSIVLWRTVSDYGIRAEWLKFFFDTQSKQLIGRVRYSPVAVGKILTLRDGLYFVANMRERPLVANWEAEGPTLVTGTEAQQVLDRVPSYVRQLRRTGTTVPFVSTWIYPPPAWEPENDDLWNASGERFFISVGERHGSRFLEGVAERIGGGHELYPMPQSSEEEYFRARPQKTAVGSIEEEIGPYQVVGDRFWFGKTFYDGEGISGVGSVGYFDLVQRKFVLFSPPALAAWSSSALLVDGDNVWVGLLRRPEGGDWSGGLLQYDLASDSTKQYEIKEIVLAIERWEDALYVGTSNGIYVLRNDQLQHFVIELGLNGEFQIVTADLPGER